MKAYWKWSAAVLAMACGAVIAADAVVPPAVEKETDPEYTEFPYAKGWPVKLPGQLQVPLLQVPPLLQYWVAHASLEREQPAKAAMPQIIEIAKTGRKNFLLFMTFVDLIMASKIS